MIVCVHTGTEDLEMQAGSIKGQWHEMKLERSRA